MTPSEFVTAQLLSKQIIVHKLVSVEIDPVDARNPSEPYYARDRLLYIFQVRLRGYATSPNQDQTLHDFLADAIKILEETPSTTKIYFWKAETSVGTLHGRSTEDRILHIYPCKQT